jgi:hypothetical protein
MGDDKYRRFNVEGPLEVEKMRLRWSTSGGNYSFTFSLEFKISKMTTFLTMHEDQQNPVPLYLNEERERERDVGSRRCEVQKVSPFHCSIKYVVRSKALGPEDISIKI